MALAAPSRMTPEEYLAFERGAEGRHALVDGEVFAMSGASRQHNRIARNVVMALEESLRGAGRCEAFVSDLRVRATARRDYYYPDVVVVCGEGRYEDDHVDTLLDPTLVLEVLSPSTEAFDRGLKFAAYRQIVSLREYVLVAQDRPLVERFRRQNDGSWVLGEAAGLDAVIELSSIGCALALADVYRRVDVASGGNDVGS